MTLVTRAHRLRSGQRSATGRVRRAVVAVVALLGPLTVAATDPADDAVPCPHVSDASGGAGVPDLVAATGEIVELGTSVRFALRFTDPLRVPDDEGRPFRVDIVMLDPDVPSVDAGLYRGINRLLRYDAVTEPITTILLLPEAGQSRFIAPTIDGDTMVVQVPGRTLAADEDESGTAPGLERLRWGVIVRDEGACDLLGDGLASERLVEAAASPSPPGPAARADVDEPVASDTGAWVAATVAGIFGLAGAVALGYVARRRARNPR